jgi:hypothetical protein
MNETEVWLDIKDYEGYYQISNLGNVKSLGRIVTVKQDRYEAPRAMHWRPRILKAAAGHPETDRRGSYLKVVLRMKGVGINFEIHRLVAKAFVPNPNDKPAVNHIDGNSLNNNALNLEWCTIRENNHHTKRIGNYVAPWSKKRLHNNLF